MKKRFLGTLFCSIFLLGASLTVVKSVEAQQLKKNKEFTDATTYVCSGSPDSSQNQGKCRTLSSGNGTMCFTFGSGTACSGTISI
jgi:hypothetical protein